MSKIKRLYERVFKNSIETSPDYLDDRYMVMVDKESKNRYGDRDVKGRVYTKSEDIEMDMDEVEEAIKLDLERGVEQADVKVKENTLRKEVIDFAMMAGEEDEKEVQMVDFEARVEEVELDDNGDE
ncbi:MAG: hypothetical protein ACOCRX_09480 [Candidatus Woesearchaeota archaeon]